MQREVNSGSIVFKIDLVNSRSMGAGSDTWEDIQIVDGVIQDLRTGEVDGFTFEAKRAVLIQRPGEFSVKTVASNDKIMVTVSAEANALRLTNWFLTKLNDSLNRYRNFAVVRSDE